MTDTLDTTTVGCLGERLQRGDVQAFEAFYEDAHAMVFNLAARITGDRDAAEDITQEVFLKSLRAFPRTRGELRPEAWIVRATVNASHDHLRRVMRRPASPLEDASEPPEPHDAFARSATVEAVEHALRALTPRYRTAILLKDLHGLSNHEVATAMNVGRGTVGVLLFRARGAFRKAYREVAAGGAVLPAGLAAVLPSLPVPSSLDTPPFDIALAALPVQGVTAPSLPAAADPLWAALARLFEPLSSKAAVVAAAAAVAAGAGVVTGTTTQPDAPPPPLPSAGLSPARVSGDRPAGPGDVVEVGRKSSHDAVWAANGAGEGPREGARRAGSDGSQRSAARQPRGTAEAGQGNRGSGKGEAGVVAADSGGGTACGSRGTSDGPDDDANAGSGCGGSDGAGQGSRF